MIFQDYAISVFICRLIPLCRTYISFFAGMFKLSLFKYSFYSIMGIIIWNTILIMCGYTLANEWNLICYYYNNYKFSLGFLLLIIVGVILFFKMYKKRKIVKNINGD